jgi:hypothetical protein
VNIIGIFWEGLVYTLSRWTFKDYALLLFFLAGVGWLLWNGFPLGLRRFGQVNRPDSDYDWPMLRPGLRLIVVLFLLVLVAIVFILAGS